MAPLRLTPLLLLLLSISANAADDTAAIIPPAVEPGGLDVRANVMRMLDEARRRPAGGNDEVPAAGEADAPLPIPAEVPADSVPAVDVRASVMQTLREEGQRDLPVAPEADKGRNRETSERLRVRRPAEERPDWYEGTIRVVPPANEAELRGDYVPVPHKTITVNSLEDLKLLREEFDAGRQRKDAEAARRP